MSSLHEMCRQAVSENHAVGRVSEPSKQRGYLNIITAEAARLTRLINNVLDFARLERGEKNYNFAECDLAALTREAAESWMQSTLTALRLSCWM